MIFQKQLLIFIFFGKVGGILFFKNIRSGKANFKTIKRRHTGESQCPEKSQNTGF
jgi:hypothetical protein